VTVGQGADVQTGVVQHATVPEMTPVDETPNVVVGFQVL